MNTKRILIKYKIIIVKENKEEHLDLVSSAGPTVQGDFKLFRLVHV